MFQYLLRHTFWRPRDILFMAGRLIAVAEYYQKHDMKLEPQTVKLVVAKNLHSIIELEFMQEFSGSLENLRFMIEKFRQTSQVLSFEAFFERVRGVKPVFLNPSIAETNDAGPSDQERILSLFFNIGFVGFYLSGRSAINQQFQTQWVFIFNEGDTILKMLSVQNRRQMQIVIHPMFIEYLGLIPFRDALVCEFTHDYLAKQEAHQLAI